MFIKEYFKSILLSKIAHKAHVDGDRLLYFRPKPTKKARNTSKPILMRNG
jgi:hypothetical protein